MSARGLQQLSAQPVAAVLGNDGAAEEHGDLAVGEQGADAVRERPRAGCRVPELAVEVVQQPTDRLDVGGLREAHARKPAVLHRADHVATPMT
jgi:hypothetical protein